MTHEVEVKFQVTSPQVFDRIRAEKQVAGPPCPIGSDEHGLSERSGGSEGEHDEPKS